MCLMAEQSLCTERGGSHRNPGGLPAYVSCHEEKKKSERAGREGASEHGSECGSAWERRGGGAEWSQLEEEWEMEKDRGEEGGDQ